MRRLVEFGFGLPLLEKTAEDCVNVSALETATKIGTSPAPLAPPGIPSQATKQAILPPLSSDTSPNALTRWQGC